MATVKIVAIGPESTGKSTLIEALAKHYNAPFISEYARDYLEKKPGHPYELADLEKIARTQVAQADEALKAQPKILFADTDLITMHIWALDKFDTPIPFVEDQLHRQQADLYLLCHPDLPWEFDELREDAKRRDELLEWNAWVLKSVKANFTEVKGVGRARTECAISAIDFFLSS